MRVRYGWTPLATILAEPNIRDLIVSYNEELNPIPDVARLDVDWPAMLKREATGTMRIWTAHAGPTLAGFIVFQIIHLLFYRQTLGAIDAGHYLAPEFRDNPARIWFGMWRTVEPKLRELGVKFAMAHDNSLHPLLPAFLYLGYEPRGTVYWKVL